MDSPEGDRELTAEQIGREIAAGTVTADTLVWRDGMSEWLEVKRVPELAAFLKKPDAPKPSPLKAAAPGGGTGRFRPRQPTLPMGALPDRAGTRGSSEHKSEPRAAEAKPAARPPAPPSETKRDQKAPATTTMGALGSRVPFLEPVPSDEEPTVLRSPDAVAALLSAAAEEKEDTPVPPRLAAQLASHRGLPSESGTPNLPPVAPRAATRTEVGSGARNPLDRITPPPSVPLGMPGALPSSERRAAAGSGPKLSPIDTFRESPEAKRAWFPEPVPGQPPPDDRGPALGAAPPAQAPAPPPPSPPAIPFQVASRAPSQLPLTPPPGYEAPAPIEPPKITGPLGSAGYVQSTALQAPPTQAGAALGEDVAFRPKKSKAIWIVLALVVVAAIAAAVYFFVLGGAKAPPPPQPVAEAPKPAAKTEPEAAPAAPAAAENTASNDGTTSDASAPAPEPAAPAAPEGNRDPLAEPPSTAPTSGGFADLFAEGAKKAAGGRFDPKVAKGAVTALFVDASRCRERNGPTGITRVAITFAPSGTVSSAVVQDPPLAGTTTAACMSSVFKRAQIPAFTGSAETITERISIQ